jgi:hypothetical protein
MERRGTPRLYNGKNSLIFSHFLPVFNTKPQGFNPQIASVFFPASQY